MQYLLRIHFPVLLLLFLASCSNNKKNDGAVKKSDNVVVIGIGSDIDTFNPVFAREVTGGEIGELIYPSLIKPDFDTVLGAIQYGPMLAREWTYDNGNRDITFHLRTDAYWSDKVRITARDVQFSYGLYGDEEIGSVRRHALDGLKKEKNGTIDIRRAVEIVDDSTIQFHFQQFSPTQLHDAGLPILPAHVFDTIPRRELQTHPVNRNPVGAGAFKIDSWKPGEDIVLSSNTQSVLPKPAQLDRIIFRVLPDHGSRFSQLKSGEIDVMADLSPAEAADLVASKSPVRVIATPARRFQFIGWNNINGTAYEHSSGKEITPHPLFGNEKIRKALTMAIDRRNIVSAMLAQYGKVAVGPVSPIFRSAYNDTLQPLPYDPSRALEILRQEGWADKDDDGVLEKNKTPFSFALTIPSGSQFNLELANIIQKQLRDIKVKVTIRQVEESVFWQQLVEKKFDAFIGGFEVPLRPQLSMFWGSDLRKHPFNFVSFQNSRIDRIMEMAESMPDPNTAAPLWKEFQVILADAQPCTFLFWENNVIGVNKKITGMNASILGLSHRAWDWDTE